jgi:hypothetical protein
VLFLPSLVELMERHGHLRLPADVRTRLLSISAAPIDLPLRTEREKMNLSVSTTHPENLLKQQIRVRTFADRNNVTPVFREADLVAHCSESPNGTFMNTLTLVGIAPGWLECMPLLRKSEGDVINGLRGQMSYYHLVFKALIRIAVANLSTMTYLITVKTGVLRSPEHGLTRKMTSHM